MKKKEDRQKKIIAWLVKNKKAEVSALAKELDISQVTLRKDLDELEQAFIVKREHGYAQLTSIDSIAGRLAYHFEEKTAIAQKALEKIHDNDTVMIESGSCCALLARQIAEKRKNVTIITNSAFIADYIRLYDTVEVVLLGGIYQRDSQCLVGPLVRETAANYHVRYFFAGTDGWSEDTGFTNRDQLRAQAVRDMAHSADSLILLTEAEKFSQIGTVPLNVSKRLKGVITDYKIPASIKDLLQEQGIQIICA
ncbi:hypothetical protein C815_00732 [Firmicutes bacterium M10-2]|nr:hypothetical protein C815_00732 [Firmicutes bacterium M10-2]